MAQTKGKTGKTEAKPRTVRTLHPDENHAARTHDASTPAELNKLVVGLGYTIESGETLAKASAYLAENADTSSETAGATMEPTAPTTGAGSAGAPASGGTGAGTTGSSA